MFVPQSVAVIGATDRESSVGRTLLANLLNGLYQGKVFAVNPKRKEVLGLHCYKNIGSIPEKIDLAVIVTPARTVPGNGGRLRGGGSPRCDRDFRRIQGDGRSRRKA